MEPDVNYLLKKLIVNLLVAIGSFGFVLPTLLSAADYILFSAGILYAIGLVFFFYNYNKDLLDVDYDKKTDE